MHAVMMYRSPEHNKRCISGIPALRRRAGITERYFHAKDTLTGCFGIICRASSYIPCTKDSPCVYPSLTATVFSLFIHEGWSVMSRLSKDSLRVGFLVASKHKNIYFKESASTTFNYSYFAWRNFESARDNRLAASQSTESAGRCLCLAL